VPVEIFLINFFLIDQFLDDIENFNSSFIFIGGLKIVCSGFPLNWRVGANQGIEWVREDCGIFL